jgi:hypothetical protein
MGGMSAARQVRLGSLLQCLAELVCLREGSASQPPNWEVLLSPVEDRNLGVLDVQQRRHCIRLSPPRVDSP